MKDSRRALLRFVSGSVALLAVQFVMPKMEPVSAAPVSDEGRSVREAFAADDHSTAMILPLSSYR